LKSIAGAGKHPAPFLGRENNRFKSKHAKSNRFK